MIEFTLKEGASYDAPWVVVKVNSIEEALNYLNDPNLGQLLSAVSIHAKGFRNSTYPKPAPAPAKPAESSSGTAKPIQQPPPGPDNPMPEGMAYTPMGEQKLPDSVAPKCAECGLEAPWKQGVSAKNTPYAGHYCQNKDCKNYWKEVKA